jgi:hypothetical protein
MQNMKELFLAIAAVALPVKYRFFELGGECLVFRVKRTQAGHLIAKAQINRLIDALSEADSGYAIDVNWIEHSITVTGSGVLFNGFKQGIIAPYAKRRMKPKKLSRRQVRKLRIG